MRYSTYASNRFLDVPQFEPLPDGKRFWVKHDFRYIDPWGEVIRVPAGFTTDFASVPSLARIFAVVLAAAFLVGFLFPSLFYPALAVGLFAWLVILIAEWLEDQATDSIACVHDWIYHTRIRSKWMGDLIFALGMRAQNSPRNARVKCVIFWLAVTVGGWWAWHDDARRRNIP